MTHSRPPTRSRCSSRTCAASPRPTASRACCTRSGEPATSSELRDSRPLGIAWGAGSSRLSASFDRLPIRVRLAGVSALLTFVILCAFAVAIGSLTVHRIRNDFNQQVQADATQLPSELTISVSPFGITPPLADFANSENHAVIKILSLAGAVA